MVDETPACDWYTVFCANCGKDRGGHYTGPLGTFCYGYNSGIHFKRKEDPMELKITREKVLEGAASCPDAKRVLEKMFPEAFKGEDRRVRFVSVQGLIKDLNGKSMIEPRTGGSHQGRGLYLSAMYDWTIEIDSSAAQVLVARHR